MKWFNWFEEQMGNWKCGSHIQLGVTVENQEQADKRTPILLQIPAAKRFVSVEPMLEEIDIQEYLYSDYDKAAHEAQLIEPLGGFNYAKLDWVIIGCESGSKRRHIDNIHIWSILEQCDDHTPVFVKQLEIDGKVTDDMTKWPEPFRVREYPK